MGCGAAKAVQTIDDNTNNANGNVVKPNKTTDKTNGNGTAAGPRRMSRPMTPVPKPVAFDISLDDDSPKPATGSAATEPLKLPPKRLLSLAEQPAQQLTAKQLSDKQLKAEEKRLELLEERKRKAHIYNEKFLPQNNNSNNNTNDLNIINDSEVFANEKKVEDLLIY
ncbi:unnamed protein product [Oppiella nova]|uniref:Uncharacterized protein n=1 Tax=Oppiella nova TaxID=334625 RepID=A0A7R9MCR6_9ACAR|nr:unnamed protein product [Oppiella nova]CAG2174908.1 unnamed protein product [Oppiella nova]